jgi:DNA-binding MarR family transcriptional regulator/anti-sigma regulatory factor (Ser/Thr protein kinase)
MDIQSLILKTLSQKRTFRAADIVKASGFSRAYVNRFLKKLEEEGKIMRIGKANRSVYIETSPKARQKALAEIFSVRKILVNKNLQEDVVLEELKKTSGIFFDLPENVSRILDYAFTEILNNAIEHSRSKVVEIHIKKERGIARFDIIDRGIGIFKNIMQKKRLSTELEAIQDLLKGKQTTAPREHSGEGIFFTSKAADILIIRSSAKKLIFNNKLDDIFIEDAKKIPGTRVTFVISTASKKELKKIFDEYTDQFLEFSKTRVRVRLYKLDTDYISRSQARRVLVGLEKFKTVILDFSKVKTVGQAFADEVFRVWQRKYPKIEVISEKANKNISFMIERSKKT